MHKVTDLAKLRIPTPQDPLPRVSSLIDGSDQFGKSPLAIPRGAELSPHQILNAETPTLRITDTCPVRDLRLYSFWEIGSRDFSL